MRITTIALLALFASCGGGNNALAPQFQPEVANLTDNFQFQTTGIRNITQTLNYTWQNTGTVAVVNQACAITSGTATLNISDPDNKAVYSADLKTNGTADTLAGVAGGWRIQVVLNNVTGTLNFRVQKKT